MRGSCNWFGLTDRFRNGMLEAGELFQFMAHDVVTKHLLGADREFFPYLETCR